MAAPPRQIFTHSPHHSHVSVPHNPNNQRSSLPPSSPVMSRAQSDLDVENANHPHLHMHRSTNPGQMHNLPDLLQLSQVDTTNPGYGARVSIDKQNAKSPTNKKLPIKALPNLPNKTLPSLPTAQFNLNTRNRSQTEHHVLGTISHHNNGLNGMQAMQPMQFNNNYNPQQPQYNNNMYPNYNNNNNQIMNNMYQQYNMNNNHNMYQQNGNNNNMYNINNNMNYNSNNMHPQPQYNNNMYPQQPQNHNPYSQYNNNTNNNYNMHPQPQYAPYAQATRNKSHTVSVPHAHATRNNRRQPPQHSHAPRNLMHIQTSQAQMRSKTPDGRRSRPPAPRKIVTPTKSRDLDKSGMINRLNKQYSAQSNDSASATSNGHNNYDENKAPPPKSKRRSRPHKPKKSKSHQAKKKPNKKSKSNQIQPALDKLRVKSTPNIAKSGANNYINQNLLHGGRYGQYGTRYQGAMSPKPMLSMSNTSTTELEFPGTDSPKKAAKTKNQNAVSDTLWHIKQKQKMRDSQKQQQIAPNMEQLFQQQQQQRYNTAMEQKDDDFIGATLDDDDEDYDDDELDKQQAFLRISRHHKGGSSMTLTKRITEHDKDYNEEQIAKALPASFAQYQKSHSLGKDTESEEAPPQIPNIRSNKSIPFVPPPPKEAANANVVQANNGYMDSESDDEDMEQMTYVNYLQGPSHVVLSSMDSGDDVLKKMQKKQQEIARKHELANAARHTRGRSNSVPVITFNAITADDDESEDSDYSFSNTPPPNMERDALIKSLVIKTGGTAIDPDEAMAGAPFEMVDDEEDDEDTVNDDDVVVLKKERSNSRSNRKKIKLQRSKSNAPPKLDNLSADKKKEHKPYRRRGSFDKIEFDTRSVNSFNSAPSGRKHKKQKKHKKKWYHGIFGGGKTGKVDIAGMYEAGGDREWSDTMSTVSAASSYTPRVGLHDTASIASAATVATSSSFDLDSNYDGSAEIERAPIFPEYVLSNKEIAQEILRVNWNFHNDVANVYRAQCATVAYESFLPSLEQILYPTITSSLSLPIKVQSATYSVYCKYNLDSFRFAATLKQQNDEFEEKSTQLVNNNSSHEKKQLQENAHRVNENNIDMVEFEFSHSTTTQQAIKQIWNKICSSASHETQLQLSSLELTCFVLKTCGREEYLRFNECNINREHDRLIVESNYIRNCLRHNEYKRIEFVLLYVDDICLLNDKMYRRNVREWYRNNTYEEEIFTKYVRKKKEGKKQLSMRAATKGLVVIDEDTEKVIKDRGKQLRYENEGYNCILSTLASSHDTNKLKELNKSVEKEVDWLYSSVGSVIESRLEIDLNKNKNKNTLGNNLNISQHRKTKSAMMREENQQIEIDWENIEQPAVLLDEFEHPIEIKLNSLNNILNAPRYQHRKSYDLIVIRCELMFGLHSFEECSWDVRIPPQCFSNQLKIPQIISTFSSEIHQLYYSMLPREAVWCFTVYGITENAEYEGARDKNAEKKKHRSKKLKHIADDSAANNNLNESELDYSVGSEFKLFNKSGLASSTSSSSYNKYSSVPQSPFTPRGGQLKTKAKVSMSYNLNYANAATSSDSSKGSSSTVSTMMAQTNGITVALSSSNTDIIRDNIIVEHKEEHSDIQQSKFNLNLEDDINDHNDNVIHSYHRYSSEPLAWCRLPVSDSRHCINSGAFELHLWRVPVFKYVKGGPKVDPYCTGFWKKFGTTKCDENSELILNIEFPYFNFDVVAPLVNPRRPEFVANNIRAYQRREFPGKQVLIKIIEQDGITPLDDKDKMLVYSNKEKLMRYPEAIPTFLRSVDWLDVELRMEAYDYLERWEFAPNPEDMCELLRSEFCDTRIRLYSINCLNQLDDYTLNRYLLQLVQALKNELHDNSFLCRFLLYRALRSPLQIGHYFFWHLLSEYESCGACWRERFALCIEEYLLHLPNNWGNYNYSAQLLYQNNLMSRLRSISTRIQYFKRRKLMNILKMNDFLLTELTHLNVQIQMRHQTLSLPLSPSLRCRSLQVSRCKFMSSAKAPLWLVFTNADEFCYLYPAHYLYRRQQEMELQQELHAKRKSKKHKSKKEKEYFKYSKYKYFSADSNEEAQDAHDLQVMFKCGDDLRQDILILQLISVMDAFWLNKNSDLRMKPYGVIQTGHLCGMLELMLCARTTNDIHSKHGTIRGAFNAKSHLIYLKSNAANNHIANGHNDYRILQENYARSCAGYSVATWVLGIADRHPSNIMIHKNGSIFHIDFGHFLGNFKEKQIANFKFNRERSPFVFTSLMKYAIDEGIDDAQLYREFVQWIFKAYCEIRSRFKFFLNLFLLMIPSHMPELITEDDVKYLRNSLRLDLTKFHDIAHHVEKTLKHCLNDKYRLVDNGIHARKHAT